MTQKNLHYKIKSIQSYPNTKAFGLNLIHSLEHFQNSARISFPYSSFKVCCNFLRKLVVLPLVGTASNRREQFHVYLESPKKKYGVNKLIKIDHRKFETSSSFNSTPYFIPKEKRKHIWFFSFIHPLSSLWVFDFLACKALLLLFTKLDLGISWICALGFVVRWNSILFSQLPL